MVRTEFERQASVRVRSNVDRWYSAGVVGRPVGIRANGIKMMIDLAREFSPYPSGRIEDDGKWNGEAFRERFLVPAIKAIEDGLSKDTEVVVDIDGVRSFGSSFLEEAFGGVGRADGIDKARALKLLRIKCTKPELAIFKDMIEEHLRDAMSAVRKQK